MVVPSKYKRLLHDYWRRPFATINIGQQAVIQQFVFILLIEAKRSAKIIKQSIAFLLNISQYYVVKMGIHLCYKCFKY